MQEPYLINGLSAHKSEIEERNKFRLAFARLLDRAADQELASGRHGIAERLARLADEIRQGGRL